ncbi:MAG: CHASE domain-containing protein [Candidatus Didemnitutus sp.]|nr:CHASE domain-containing protein [Candidatus Didemnitutus sp.]
MPSLFHYHRWLLGAVVVIGLIIALVSWRSVQRIEDDRIAASFQRRAESQAHASRERIRLYEEMVLNLRSLFINSAQLTRQEFERVCADILVRHPAVQALQWVAFVEDHERDEFERAAREDYPGFTVREPDGAGGLRPSARFEDYTIIRLIVPLEKNEAALGYANSRSPIGGILVTARRERRMVVTHQFRLAQAAEPGTEQGVVFAAPLFGTIRPDNSDGFRGFVQIVFRIETMLSQPHRNRPDAALLVYYTDLDAPSPDSALLYVNRAGNDSTPFPERLGMPANLTYRQIIELGGRRWEFFAEINPVWRARQQTILPKLVFLIGLVSTGVIALLLHTLLRRNEEIERQVATRTEELEQTKSELEEDIRRRREAELALQASEQRLEAILANSSAAIFVKDLQGRYTQCNDRFEQVCGRPRVEIIGHSDQEMFPPEFASVFVEHDQQVITRNEAIEFEESFNSPRGITTSIVQKFLLRDSNHVTYGLCGIATDITDRLNAEKERIAFERQLLQTQKLESLGVLAGGIAHDFNNILTAVLGNATLARHQLPRNSPATPQLQQIEEAARRAAELCAQMLAYAGKGNFVSHRFNLSDLVKETASLLEVSVNKSTRLHLTLAPTLPAIFGDATQLRQIVMNLVLNAAEAIGERPGEIQLSTFTEQASTEQLSRAVQNPSLPGGLYVGMEVRDNGNGMPPELIPQIFEPFFTTRFAGRGLGLAAVLGIVRSHQGALFVESGIGKGTIFRLLLPVAEAEIPTTNLSTMAPVLPVGNFLPELKGTVLVVDDETFVREITGIVLGKTGLKVLEAPDGLAAIKLVRANRTQIDLVLLDLTMPILSGEETLRQIREIDGRLKVILMSGYSENDATKRCLKQGAVAFVQKPFEVEHLLSLIATHLAS